MPDVDTKLDSAENSDKEGETFEDAPDTSSRPQSRSSASVRSLTDRPPSSTSITTPRVSTNKSSGIEETSRDGGSVSPLESAGEPVKTSPSLSARRLSTTSLDDVQLATPQDANSSRSRSTTITSNDSAAITASQPPKPPPRMKGFSGNLATVPFAPPPPAPPASSKPTAATSVLPPPRKLGGPFSWLSRNSSAKTDNVHPPVQTNSAQPTRRNTTTSIAGSNSELMLNRLDEGNESDHSTPISQRQNRNQLRDRFKMLRMREEAGIQQIDGPEVGSPTRGGVFAGLIGRSASVGLGIGSPTSFADEKESGLASSPVQSPVSPIPPSNTLTSPVNPSLAPGTASGLSAGPSAMKDPADPVDWDLWQSVVYEGPAAVAKTSAEELNTAIASGIPSAIRGVVWQVLAQSKNEELEGVYRDLVARGTDNDRDLKDMSANAAQGLSNGQTKEKTSITSSASSVHSNHSSLPTNGMTSPTHSQHDKDSEGIAKLQAAMRTERIKKAKEDAAALQKLEKAIKRDLGTRTSFSKYAASAGLQDGLFGVCKAYALFDEAVGYAQGMNFLVMPLLFNMPEEEAFCLLVRLMNHYHLRDMFVLDMPGLHLHLYQFERLLEDLEPALYCHLHRRAVPPQLYATQWFLTLFAYRFPLQLVLRVHDLVLSEGLEGAILKFGIVLMRKNAQALLGMHDMVGLTNFLKEKIFDVYIDQAPTATSILESGFFGSSGGIDKEIYRADVLVQDACAIKITPETLATYTAEWELKVKIEKDREAEMESNRSANASLALKVRSLEERIEQSDAEHVQMASELVRTKVLNEELHDKNDSLDCQVVELRKVVERQPEEVEERLKAEMDRIMTRNLEVQNENRGLEEQMADMEKALVETKMDYAVIQAEYETLKQKWNDLRKAIGA
ncbi:MAG: hypothetical protein L6R37_005484 [Teloschistes peruensis]|nr:MAG: hypothetical protein L6R37_005484 [Teloschistes peruensis]